MAQELTFNISEDRRKLQGPVEAKNFNLKFGTDDVAITHGNPKQWVQGRIGDNELKQVFVNITEGENNTPKDVAGLFLAFVGIIHDKDGRPHRVVDYKHSTTIDVEHGRFRFDFPDQAFTVAGEYQQAFFMLVKEGPGGGCVATMEFDMQVMANFVFTDLVPEDYITPFNDTVDQLLAACKKFKDDTAADEAKFKQELEDAYAKFQKDTNTQFNNFKDATNEDLAKFKKANADDIAKFKQQYADAVQAKEDELQSKVDSYTDKIDTMLKDLNQQGIDTTTMLTDLRSQMAALQDKIKSENFFTEDEAEAFKQTLQETVQNTLDEFQSQFNGPAFKEAQQASLDTNMMYGESLPPYFQNSFNHVTQGIPTGNNIVNIATIADNHWQEDGASIFDGYTAKSLEHYQWCALSTLYNHADALIALGDNINGDEPTGRLNMTTMHARAMLQTKYVRTAMFMIRGNHDNGAGHQNTEGKFANEVLDDNSVKNGYGTKFNYYGEVRDGDSLYFYKDLPEKKVRIVGLDSNDIPLEKKDSNGHYAYDTNTAGFRAQQLNWFANKALMLPDNTWQVVVFFHIPFPNAFGQWAEDNTFKNYHHAIAILNAFKNGTSVNINDTSNPDFTITGLQADYSKQGQGTLIAVVNGHLHRDDQDTSILNGTPIIEVTTSASFVSSVVNDSKQRNTNDEDAWDIISINTKERKIHCYRFGRGNDRDFTY